MKHKMKPLVLYSLLSVLCTITSLPQELNLQDEKESEIYMCILQEFNKININIEKELSGFEAYLLKNNYLSSSSVEGYKGLLQELTDLNNIPLSNTYSIKNLDTNSVMLLQGCLNSSSIETIAKNLVLSTQVKLLNTILKTEKPDEFYHLINAVISQSDIANPLHRLFIRYNYYILTKPYKNIPWQANQLPENNNYYFLRIGIDSNEIIHIGTELTDLKHIRIKIQNHLEKENIKDASTVLIILKIDPQVNLRFLAEFKNLLLDMKLQKIIFG